MYPIGQELRPFQDVPVVRRTQTIVIKTIAGAHADEQDPADAKDTGLGLASMHQQPSASTHLPVAALFELDAVATMC